MDLDSCYRAGYVIKKHGFRGEVRVHFDMIPQKKPESLFLLIDGTLIPFFIDRAVYGEAYSVIKFSEVNTESEAERLTRKEVYLPNALRPSPPAQTLELKTLVGYSVYHQARPLGPVVAVQDGGLNPLLVVQHRGKEILIPANEHFVAEVNSRNKTLAVELPAGFLDIWEP